MESRRDKFQSRETRRECEVQMCLHIRSEKPNVRDLRTATFISPKLIPIYPFRYKTISNVAQSVARFYRDFKPMYLRPCACAAHNK